MATSIIERSSVKSITFSQALETLNANEFIAVAYISNFIPANRFVGAVLKSANGNNHVGVGFLTFDDNNTLYLYSPLSDTNVSVKITLFYV